MLVLDGVSIKRHITNRSTSRHNEIVSSELTFAKVLIFLF